MSSVVTDTHALLWHLLDPGQLSPPAAAAFRDAADAGVPVFVPSICLVEITYLTERGRIPPEALRLVRDSLAIGAASSPLALAPLDLAVADALAAVPRDQVPDMPDRIIAATAVARALPLVTRDAQIRSAPAVRTIW